MKPFSAATLALLLQAILLLAPTPAHAAPAWVSTHAEHVYGFPDIKHHKKGTLTLSPDTLSFLDKSSNTSIPRAAVTAVSAGNERVEIWGIGGRILRMTIPNGGGIAAAAFMHHRIDMLTVEFRDARGADHSAVFFLPANEAQHALDSFALPKTQPRPMPETATEATTCQPGTPNLPIDPRSLLVVSPTWDHAQVPAAYRALLYEHVIDRLRALPGIGRIYRDGEGDGHTACPQYTLHIAIETFREGSSVKRAFMGPVGLFVGTTQMNFHVIITDATGASRFNDQVKSTIRGESESTNVADHVAKTIAKRYANLLKTIDKANAPTVHPIA
jgi:hypothetical protein